MKSDGSYVGRASPEIDIIEATIHDGVGYVSLSGQWAPYNVSFEPSFFFSFTLRART
jgi:hypothetical protein